MHLYEIADELYAKKKAQELNKEQIKILLQEEYNLTADETLTVLRTISSRELDEINQPKTSNRSVKQHFILSIGFVILALFAMGYSLFILLTQQVDDVLLKVLPYVIILGSFFILYKHFRILINLKR